MNNSVSQKELSQILRFWHQVEFFIPFDLQQQVIEAEDAEWAVNCWSIESFRRADRPLWSPRLPLGRRLAGFDVYFGVFDKSLLAEVTQQVLHESSHPNERLEQEERGDLEGLTCMAKIRTGPGGEPLLDEVSVSTAPWALGRIRRPEQLAALDFDAFQDGIKVLKESVRQFRAQRHTGENSDEHQQTERDALSGKELLALLAIFEEWTGFHPEPSVDDAPVIVIRAWTVENSSKPRSKEAAPNDLQPERVENSPEDDDDEASDSEDDIEINILNSFFASDIDRAITSVERGEHSPALNAYLTPLPLDKRLDIYSPQGREAILRTLSPARLPAAHWPDKPAHAMSLMQQFAINSLLERLETEGIFSVNGPPGTGKTTLLRDVFAELITRRARVLACLATASDAFIETVKINFRGENAPCYVKRLREDLSGFEMVVASSNNAAVENLSRDLPKAKSLGKAGETPWREDQGCPTIGYLQTVAQNIAARKPNGDYTRLDSDDTPWGLIACALGKKRDRSNFAYRLTADARNAEQPPKGFDPDVHQSLWTWRDEYKGPKFDAARKVFVAADEAVKQRIAHIERYAVLCALQHGQTLESFCASCDERITRSWQVLEAAQAELKPFDQERELCTGQLRSLREEAQLIERGRPPWWLRLFLQARSKQYGTDIEDNRLQQRFWLSRQREVKARYYAAERQFQGAMREHASAKDALTERKQEWQSLQREWQELASLFPQMDYPQSADALENQCWQIDGLWHDETLNNLRSELFIAALGLHEAWLATVLQEGRGFGGNVYAISHLLSGKRPEQSEDALAIWQSLFMIVPVISSTFASIASQFRDLGLNSLGWLFIDEAGQAVPQAAVGALWRTKRAVVVGDPLQIEPVFTVPIKLIEALESASHLPGERQVAPHRVSVQTLADLANALGTEVGTTETSQWIGSPLRVHRRCVDPMFTIANEIAYQGKMIFFDPDNPKSRLPPPDSLDLGPSAWVNVGGKVQDKHAVPEQIDLICQAASALYQRTHQLPALYVISPFKRVKNALVRRLSKADVWSADNRLSARELREWCKERIGTVHTFQGKEETVVWMVLGCDASTRGAAEWAASKPNLLNVALTRARHRFFVIGDAELWAGLDHFRNATEGFLPRIHADVFLQRVRGRAADEASFVVGAEAITNTDGG